jgi:hypothetical protein
MEKEKSFMTKSLHRISKGIRCLIKGDFRTVFQYFRHYIYKTRIFTTEGNRDLEIPTPRIHIDGLKIAVYSCITDEYDTVLEPLSVEPDIDYYLFTDGDIPSGSKWKKIDITKFKEYTELTSVQLNRKIKLLPFKYLPDYDYSIYIDGNIEIVAPLSPLIEEMGNHAFGVHYHRTRDCIYDELVQVLYLKKADPVLARQQVAAYKKDGFPPHFGLYENPILIRKHSDEEIRRLMEIWWEEYMRYPTRDQLSLPYVVWKMGYDRGKIHIIAKNMDENPGVKRIHGHKK